jgi:arylsulfatase A-like enzyme
MVRTATRREFLVATMGSAALISAKGVGQSTSSRRPNVLFILADDMGYGDLSCYGRPDYQTPVLDNLARQGIRFTSAYAAAPVCTPTRCAFVTGRYPHRLAVGLKEPLTDPTSDIGLPPEHPTVASLLKANGYQTALVGKWHLGWKPEFGPNRHGYEEFFGILSGAADYFTHRAEDFKGSDLWENLTPVQHSGYLTDLLTEKAVEFIGRPRNRPFYLSLHYTAPHSPWEGPEDAAIDHQRHGRGPMVEGGSLKVYASLVRSMDAGIGRVLTALTRAKLDRETLVIFTSDNGGERYSFNWPFSSGKMSLWEGGTRVPAIARWPGVIRPGQTTEQAAITMDWTATILAAAGTAPEAAYPLDGENLLPVCAGTRPAYDRTFCWRTTTESAARMGRWKYLRESSGEQLFDLSSDPGEKVNLRNSQVEVFERIKKLYGEWNARMLPQP